MQWNAGDIILLAVLIGHEVMNGDAEIVQYMRKKMEFLNWSIKTLYHLILTCWVNHPLISGTRFQVFDHHRTRHYR